MYPFALPSSMPAQGSLGWAAPLESNLSALRDRTALHEATYGVPLDSWSGSDDQRLQAAMAYAKAQTRPPAIVLANRLHTFSGGPYPYYPGLKLVGALGHSEREFSSTGPHTVVNVGGSALFSVPSGGVRNLFVTGIQFRATSGSVNFQTPVTDFSSGPIIQDGTWKECAWVGFSTIMHARMLRALVDRTYVNNGTSDQFKIAGSDNYLWPTGGYMSSTQLAASRFYIWMTHMSRTWVGPLYITPEKATAVRIDGSYSGLTFDRTMFDSTNRTATTACQGAAVLITGGRGITFSNCYWFNNAVNPAATGRSPQDRGQVYIRGSASDITFTAPQFVGGDQQTLYTPSGTPAIYAVSTVSAVKVIAPMAPYGGAKLLQQGASGIIQTAAASDWTVAVA
ncbi:hypothetical protein ACFVH6_21820 [Spirillospora sp. NPDC127200]